MRWDALFRDLEGQALAQEESQWRREVAERTRGERATVALAARIAAARGTAVAVDLADGSRIAGDLVDSGGQWLLLDDDGLQRLVPLASVAAIAGLPRRADALTAVEERLTLSHALRALSRDRARVSVRCGVEVVGVIHDVGADHIDIQADAPREVRTVPIASIVEVSAR
ncbi:hypothetical protein [Demequina sp. NBRC 110053]|uniref:hypothetical protein n=1 Tax=Demequina sp. NBRC 110053 TaxID=1570342 RepID=UPI0009FF2E27|nr:hypothetical protein [Demequina sp. NBRC 110053]